MLIFRSRHGECRSDFAASSFVPMRLLRQAMAIRARIPTGRGHNTVSDGSLGERRKMPPFIAVRMCGCDAKCDATDGRGYFLRVPEARV